MLYCVQVPHSVKSHLILSRHGNPTGWGGNKRLNICPFSSVVLGRPRGIGWRGRWEKGSVWGIHVNPWLIHVNVWQKPLQYCKVISLQLIKINGKKEKWGPWIQSANLSCTQARAMLSPSQAFCMSPVLPILPLKCVDTCTPVQPPCRPASPGPAMKSEPSHALGLVTGKCVGRRRVVYPASVLSVWPHSGTCDVITSS